MDLTNIVGFNVSHAGQRRNYRTLHYSPDREGESSSSLLFIEKGHAFFDFGKGAIRVGSDQLICYSSNQLKKAWSDPIAPVSYKIIVFDILSRLGTIILPADIGIPFLFKPKSVKRIKSQMDGIIKTWNSAPSENILRCSIQGLQLLEIMAQSNIKVETSHLYRGIIREDDHIALALEYMRTHYKAKLSSHELAKIAGLKRVTFFKRFKKTTGMTPRQFMLEQKIEQAKGHILIDNNPFAYEAHELGFCDYSNFHRTFKRIAGMTPLAFYKMHRSNDKAV